jgi:hypothetical protein
MVRSRRKPVSETQEILTTSGTQALLEEKRELEDTLREADHFGQGSAAEQLDKEGLRKQIRNIDNTIEALSPRQAKGKTKDSLIRESKNLAEFLKEGLPTKYEMDHPAKCPGAVRKNMAWLARTKEAVKRWRYIQNVINPDAPESIEDLREPGKPRY